jgi:hypothetical protein
MRRTGFSLGLLFAVLVGCTPTTSLRPSTFLDRLQSPSGPDVVVMVVATIEQTAGDRYLNNDLWTMADEQSVAIERRSALEDNGFRVGQIAGITPDGLQELLLSPRATAAPQQFVTHAGNATTIPLGTLQADCRFHVQRDSHTSEASFKNARCSLKIVPALAPDGRIRLEFTPQIVHGDNAVTTKPNAERTGWEMRHEQPTETYTHLIWDVTLAPGEFVVVGARLDKPDTLGQRCFFEWKEDAKPVQRLLAIRTGRALSALTSRSSPAGAMDPAGAKSPPLALQAAWSSVRGTSQ